MSFSSADLMKRFPELQLGNAIKQASANCISACENYSSESLVFCNSESYSDTFYDKAPAIIITTAAIAKSLASLKACILISPNLRLSHAQIKQAFHDYDPTDSEWPEIHPQAVIHESAKIGQACRIGPNVVIGANTQIGKNSIVRAGCVIEHGVNIGENCVIHSLCNIGYSSQIGNNVIIRSNSVIGNEGFGLAQDENGLSYRIPHTGNVVLSDDVQIGANCNIDRGTYGATTIGRGTKLDAQCHIAHNVSVGEDCIITAQCVIAGSSTIGNRVIMSGQTGVLDHKTIVDDVILVHRCGVTQNINEKGTWAGTPAKKLKAYVKDQQLAKRVDQLKQRLTELEDQLHKG